jgi:hypothetical protein
VISSDSCCIARALLKMSLPTSVCFLLAPCVLYFFVSRGIRDWVHTSDILHFCTVSKKQCCCAVCHQSVAAPCCLRVAHGGHKIRKCSSKV